jgi:TonB-linked SusC/RagA family outer membrane protein
MKQKILKCAIVSLCLLVSGVLFAQKTITGTITDEAGVPLPGATIIVVETNEGTTTDFDGNYSILASDGNTIDISYIGYTKQSISVADGAQFSVSLQPDSLDEVVVTALGIKRNTKALGYSVTQVGGESVSEVKSTNALQALQGKIAGVQVTGNATGAKGSTRVIIRGNSSLTGNNMPLYIVDGIPIDNTNLGSAGVWGGADGGDGISAINPDEVESISVLKGGAAAALYGSRASNGAILITTKTGAGVEGIQVEISSSIQFDDIKNDPFDPQTIYGQGRDFSTTSDTADTMAAWGPRMDGSSVEQWDGVSRPYSYTGNNMEKFYRTGQTLINTLAVTSASETQNLRFSFSNLQNEDIMPQSDLARNTLGLNATQNFGKFTLTSNVKYIYDDMIGSPRLSDAPGNANFHVRMLAPSLDIMDMQGPGGYGTNLDGTEFPASDSVFFNNAWFSAYQYVDNSVRERFIGSVNLRYDITDWLYTAVKYGTDRFDRDRTFSEPFGTGYKPLGGINESKQTREQRDLDLFIGTDNLEIIEDFSLTAFVGMNENYTKFEQTSGNGNDFIIPGLSDIKNTVGQSVGYNFSEREISSVFGSAEFGYKDAAYLTITARNDWFSTLSLPGKTTPNDDLYTSASLSLVLSDLLSLPEAISFAKVRAGYSQVAGGADNPYTLSLAYGIYGQGHEGASLGRVNNGSIPNSNITPFEKDETEFGFDLRLLDNKYSIDFTYYDNQTDGDIVGVSASNTSGYGSALANLGQISNKGVEILLNASVIDKEDFGVDLFFNYANNESEIVSTNDAGTNISMDEPRPRNLRVTHIVGEQYGALFGTSYNRDDQGRIIHNIEADGTPIAQVGPRKILGFGVAPTSLGIGSTIRYKDFNFNFLIEGKSGGQIYSGTDQRMKYHGLHKDTIDADGRENGFTVSGVDAAGAAFTTTITPERIEDYWRNTYNIAEEAIQDVDYLRLRQLSLGYNFPSETLEGTFIKAAQIALIGRNLFFLKNAADNIDPESGYNTNNSQGLEYLGMPIPRSIGFNVNLKF